PSDWYTLDADCELEDAGTIPTFSRTIFRFKGLLRISDTSGSIFRFRSGQASADDEQIGWVGERASDVEFISPRIAFRGNPRLCRLTSQGSSHNINGPISWKSAAAKLFSPIGLVGPIEAIWPVSGDVQFRSRLVLLGDADFLTAQAGESPITG